MHTFSSLFRSLSHSSKRNYPQRCKTIKYNDKSEQGRSKIDRFWSCNLTISLHY